MKKTYKNKLPKDMEVESTNIRVENGELIVEIEFEDKYVPKFGDIVRVDLLEDDADFKECQYMVSIYPDKKFSECNDFFDIATLTRGKDIEYIAGSFVKSISKATEAEKQELFEKLAKVGKRWNPDKKCLEDIKLVKYSEKVAKSMLAIAQISQLMPYYGGEITEEEWGNSTIKKHIISRKNKELYGQCVHKIYSFLAFHTSEQRDEFLTKNEELIKTYFMI